VHLPCRIIDDIVFGDSRSGNGLDRTLGNVRTAVAGVFCVGVRELNRTTLEVSANPAADVGIVRASAGRFAA